MGERLINRNNPNKEVNRSKIIDPLKQSKENEEQRKKKALEMIFEIEKHRAKMEALNRKP